MSTSKNIWQAASTGDPIALERCLRQKPAKNRRLKVSNLRDNHNWTVLHHAAASGSAECVELLLSRTDSDPKARCYEGRTPLLLACLKAGDAGPVMEVIRALVEANGELASIPNNECVAPLHVAAERGQLELVEYLVEHGAFVDARDYGGETPLHLALVGGQLEIVIHLLFVGRTDLNVHSDVELSALEILAARGNYEVRRKIACFKVVFNFLHHGQEYREKYNVEDIYTVASVSCRSVSLIPYFVRSALLYETNCERREMMLYLLERCPRVLENQRANLYHYLLLLIVDYDGIQQLDRKIVVQDIEELIPSEDVLPTELASFCLASINDGEEHLQMLVKYLNSVQHLMHFCAKNLLGTLVILLRELSNRDPLSKDAFKRYESIVETIIQINRKPTDELVRHIWSRNATFPELTLMRPIVSFCTWLFMVPRGDGERMDSACWQEFGSFEAKCEEAGFSLESCTLQRLARDTIRTTVLSAIDENQARVDLEFVKRLERLSLPLHLVKYLRYC